MTFKSTIKNFESIIPKKYTSCTRGKKKKIVVESVRYSTYKVGGGQSKKKYVSLVVGRLVANKSGIKVKNLHNISFNYKANPVEIWIKPSENNGDRIAFWKNKDSKTQVALQFRLDSRMPDISTLLEIKEFSKTEGLICRFPQEQGEQVVPEEEEEVEVDKELFDLGLLEGNIVAFKELVDGKRVIKDRNDLAYYKWNIVKAYYRKKKHIERLYVDFKKSLPGSPYRTAADFRAGHHEFTCRAETVFKKIISGELCMYVSHYGVQHIVNTADWSGRRINAILGGQV